MQKEKARRGTDGRISVSTASAHYVPAACPGRPYPMMGQQKTSPDTAGGPLETRCPLGEKHHSRGLGHKLQESYLYFIRSSSVNSKLFQNKV